MSERIVPAVNPAPLPDAVASIPATPSRCWRYGVPLVVVLLTLLSFMPALLAGYSYWDDDDLLFGVEKYRTLSLESVRWMWNTSYAGHFQPLTWLSYWLDYQWTHHDAFGYHLTNVAWHLGNAVVFYLVVLRLLRIGSKGAWRGSALYVGAGVGALIFSIHPLRAESVAWIAERRDVLSGFFYLLAIHFYLRFAAVRSAPVVAPDARRTGGLGFFIACWFCMLLSVLSKASGVMLPLVFLVLDGYPLGRLSQDGCVRGRLIMRAVLEKVPFLVLALIVGLRALQAQDDGGAMYALRDHDLMTRAAQSVYGYAFYLWKFFVPVGLGPLYPIPQRAVLLGPMLLMASITVAGALGVALLLRRRFPILLAALTVYLIQLFPVVGIFQSGPQLVADRYSYLPCLGFAVVVGAVAAIWFRRRVGASSSARALGTLLTCVVLFSLSHLTFRQCGFWDTPSTLWARGVDVSPESSIALVNYADALAETGDPIAAIRMYDRSLRLEARDPIATSHFGRVLARVGDYTRAAALFELTVQLDPKRARDYRRLADAMIRDQRPGAAVGVLTRRVQQAPHDLAAVDMLAALQSTHPDAGVRDGVEAVRWAEHLHRARGGQDPGAMLTLSTALAESGDFDRAVLIAGDAIAIGMKGGHPRLIEELQRRLVLFRAGKPYHYGS